MNKPSDSAKIHKARTIGLFFILAFLAYGIGRHFFKSEGGPEKYLGAALIFSNSILVLFIGLFLRETLKQYNVWVGNIYLITRVFEALALASILLNLMPSLNVPEDAGYFLAMLVLGLGSLPMCLELYKQKIAPAWLALGGFIGYTVFSFGFLMELLGKEWSMYLLAPGGAWEITFAFWLMLRKGQKIIHDPSPAEAGLQQGQFDLKGNAVFLVPRKK